MAIEIEPLVLPIGRPTAVVVSDLTPEQRYMIQVRSVRQESGVVERELVAGADGRLCLELTCPRRGEYTVDVFPVPAHSRLARLHVFAAPEDQRMRRPLRCDLHIHTTYSDGRNLSAEMVIRGRELGLDVVVITDHNNYQGSLDAIAACAELELNVITMPGEEVTAPTWHLLSIGADAGIYELIRQAHGLHEAAAHEAWKAGEGRTYAALRQAVDLIRAHGGRVYVCHPYWSVDRGFNMPVDMYDQLLADEVLDGVELLGDVEFEDNLRSLARYLDFRAAGHNLPILGNSDTHAAGHTYGVYWTLVWTREATPQGVLEAIAGGWSVACTTVKPVDPALRLDALQITGPFELVDYAYFIEQQVFPRHDVLCREEAALAYRIWRGEKPRPGAMAAFKASMEELYRRYWGG